MSNIQAAAYRGPSRGMNPQQPFHDAPGIAACGLLVDQVDLPAVGPCRPIWPIATRLGGSFHPSQPNERVGVAALGAPALCPRRHARAQS
jgi:hypothetical protein